MKPYQYLVLLAISSFLNYVLPLVKNASLLFLLPLWFLLGFPRSSTCSGIKCDGFSRLGLRPTSFLTLYSLSKGSYPSQWLQVPPVWTHFAICIWATHIHLVPMACLTFPLGYLKGASNSMHLKASLLSLICVPPTWVSPVLSCVIEPHPHSIK